MHSHTEGSERSATSSSPLRVSSPHSPKPPRHSPPLKRQRVLGGSSIVTPVCVAAATASSSSTGASIVRLNQMAGGDVALERAEIEIELSILMQVFRFYPTSHLNQMKLNIEARPHFIFSSQLSARDLCALNFNPADFADLRQMPAEEFAPLDKSLLYFNVLMRDTYPAYTFKAKQLLMEELAKPAVTSLTLEAAPSQISNAALLAEPIVSSVVSASPPPVSGNQSYQMLRLFAPPVVQEARSDNSSGYIYVPGAMSDADADRMVAGFSRTKLS